MSGESEPSFKLECPECSVSHSADDFEVANEFYNKHSDHTGHEMEWARAEFQHSLTSETQLEVSCEVCNETWQFGTVTEASEFKDEHASYTDHEITEPPIEIEIDILKDATIEPSTIKSFIEKIEDGYDKGVPEQAIFSQFSDEPASVAKAKQELEKLKQRGEVYEPRTNRLLTT